MMRMNRREAPRYLIENAARWTASYVARRRADPAYRFRWPEVSDGEVRLPLNRRLLRELLAATAGHCAYCDGFPMGETSRETIDHFRPKGDERYHHLAFEWQNLFPACDRCQDEKSDEFDDRLLKPDELSYAFDSYFDFNARTGELEPNRRASVEDQERSWLTIATFGLNLPARCASRLRYFERCYRDAVRLSEDDMDSLPYRYLALAAP